jgi:branched-chain amino acid transport system substrate-binding protein
MKKTVFFLLVLATIFVFSHTLISTAHSADKIVKIGGVYPLTGYLSWLGEYYKKAAILQVDQINKAGGVGGYKLELVIYDDQSSPEEGTRAALRLIQRDNVVAITGTATAPITGAVSSIANKHKVPAVMSSGYDLRPDKEPFAFNTAHPTFFAVARPFQYLKKEGITKVGLLMPIGSLGEIGIRNAQKAASQYGLTIVGEERYDIKSPDVTAQLAKLRASKPEAIFSFTTGEPAALIARNMQQLKFDVPLIVSHGNATPGFLKLVSRLSVKLIVPSGKIMAPDSLPNSDPSKAVIMEFNKLHMERYGEPANYFSGLLSDAVSLIAQGIRVSGSTDPEKIREGIEKIKNFVALGGVYNMSHTDHYGTRIEDMIVLTVKDGKWQLIQ